MGKGEKRARQAFEDFVRNIPNDKLDGPFADGVRTLYENKNYRLDREGVRAIPLFTCTTFTEQAGMKRLLPKAGIYRFKQI